MNPKQSDSLSHVSGESHQVDMICDRFEAAWVAGSRPSIEVFLEDAEEACRSPLLRELLLAEWDLLVAAGEAVELPDYLSRFPDHADQVATAHQAWLAETSEEAAGSLDALSRGGGGANAPLGFHGRPDLRIPGYEIQEVLGRGGMGVVYRARDVKLKRDVALKMVLAGRDATPGERARFFSEAEAVASLKHPNIVQVYEVSQQDDHPFMVLEYVSGGTLSARLAEGPLPTRDAAELVKAVASGMNVAHQSGLVHRDVKPANILMDDGGTPKLTDFGLVKQLENESGLTLSGTPVGTPSYMAPEQAAGQSNRVGPAADVYSLGATLYACLTGVPPHQADSTVETLRRVVEEEPIPLRQVSAAIPRDLETICLKALRKDPARRYPSAAAFAEDLACWLEHRPIMARPTSGAEHIAKWCRRRPAVAGLLLVSVLAAISLIGGATFFSAKLRQSNINLQDERNKADAARSKAVKKQREAEVQRGRADRQKEEAKREAEKAAAVADFLVGLFEDTDVFGLSGRTFGVLPHLNPSGREILNRGRKKLADDQAFADDPLLKATLEHHLGKSYLSLGDVEAAQALLESSLELRATLLPDDHPEYAASLHENALLRCFHSDVGAGIDACRDVLELRRRIHGDDHRLTLESELQLGIVLVCTRQLDAARPHLQHVAEVRRARLAAAEQSGRKDIAAEAEALGAAVTFLATVEVRGNTPWKVLPLIEEVKQLAQHVPDQAKARAALELIAMFKNVALDPLGRNPETEASFQRAMAAIEEVLGADHYLMYFVLLEYQGMCYEQGIREERRGSRGDAVFMYERFGKAESLGRRRLEIVRKVFPENPSMIAEACYQLSRAIIHGRACAAEAASEQVTGRPRFNEAELLAREAVDRSFNQAGTTETSGTYEFYLAWLLVRKDPADLAEPTVLYRRAWQVRCDRVGYDHVISTASLSRVLDMLARQGEFQQLGDVLDEHLSRLSDQQAWEHIDVRKLVEIAVLLEAHGEADTALRLLEQAVQAGFDVKDLPSYSEFCRLSERPRFQAIVEHGLAVKPKEKNLFEGLRSLLE